MLIETPIVLIETPIVEARLDYTLKRKFTTSPSCIR